MATYEFKLPDIGEGVTEGEIVQWLVSPGDDVAEDQPMVEVMTDKATVTITSPKAGKILETRAPVGGVVAVHSVLVVFDLGGAASSSASASSGAAASSRVVASTAGASVSTEPAATAVGDIKESLPGMDLSTGVASALDSNLGTLKPNNGGAPSGYFNAKPLATPATRKLARDLGVDLRNVPPTGPHQRVTKDDVWAKQSAARPPAMPSLPVPSAAMIPAGGRSPAVSAPSAGAARSVPVSPMQISDVSGDEGLSDERIPLRGVRKRIFEGMSRSMHTAVHFTFVEECDASALMAIRARLKPVAEGQGVKLTYLPFIVKAVVAALKKHPSLNSAFDEVTQEIVVRRRMHVGIASATEAGLIVPVVRNADRMSILDIAREIARLGDATREGKVRPDDLGGSTFTITSLGQQGGLFATPVLNFPEVGILGVHQIKKKPVVRDGEIVVGDVMLLSLSFDHRIIDGHVGAAFAYEIIGFLEDPDRLFLEMA